MLRNVIRIDESKCDGCGICVDACHEGAIQLVDGKARVVSESYCDGLGACLGECPQGAISLTTAEAVAFSGPAPGSVAARSPAVLSGHPRLHAVAACPGSAVRQMAPSERDRAARPANVASTSAAGPDDQSAEQLSMLSHWPVQLMLVPPGAPFLKGSNLVVCADCVPFAVPDFHKRYLDGRSIVVGCPKLDDLDHYREKLKAIIAMAAPAKLTVVRMEVPCCGGIAAAVVEARDLSAPGLPVEVHTVKIGGDITSVVR